MGLKKEMEEYYKFKSRNCANREARYQNSSSTALYEHTHICPYFDVTEQSCKLNVCYRNI